MEKITATIKPIRIAIVGAESSGKTTLAKMLEKELHCIHVPEFSRFYLKGRTDFHHLTIEDVLAIENRQSSLEQLLSTHPKNQQFLISDTDTLVNLIWLKVVYQTGNLNLEQKLQTKPHHLYLLCHPSIPYEPDPMRFLQDSPEKRFDIFSLYEEKIKQFNLNSLILKGSPLERLTQALSAIHRILTKL